MYIGAVSSLAIMNKSVKFKNNLIKLKMDIQDNKDNDALLCSSDKKKSRFLTLILKHI